MLKGGYEQTYST